MCLILKMPFTVQHLCWKKKWEKALISIDSYCPLMRLLVPGDTYVPPPQPLSHMKYLRLISLKYDFWYSSYLIVTYNFRLLSSPLLFFPVVSTP